MGGFPVLVRCLDSPHPSLRAGAAGLIGDICQNNLQCQENMLALKVVPQLLQVIDGDEEATVRVKAMYAVSCKSFSLKFNHYWVPIIWPAFFFSVRIITFILRTYIHPPSHFHDYLVLTDRSPTMLTLLFDICRLVPKIACLPCGLLSVLIALFVAVLTMDSCLFFFYLLFTILSWLYVGKQVFLLTTSLPCFIYLFFLIFLLLHAFS